MWRSRTSCRWMTVAAAAYALALSGCASTRSGIDPSGERVFATVPPTPVPPDQGYHDEPLGQLPWDDDVVLLQPTETVASVGSEVVLKAGVGAKDGTLRTNRRLEWTVAPGSVGHFVAVGKNGLLDLLLGDFNQPGKINSTYAIGSTSRDYLRLNRGTCTPENDVYVLRGQGWITLTSPMEGTSHVTVVAPEVYSWDARIKSAMVHWVDAHWRFPPPAINPAGTKHVFTTTVVRQTNQTPIEGWRVRYEIAGGPPAGFAPDGAQAIEVPTSAAGQANAEIFQKQPAHGTNKVCIQVIRPGDLPGANGRRLVVGSGTTTKTWTAADLSVHKNGPSVAGIGAAITYRIEITNPGDLAAKDVALTDTIPDGLAYLSSNPSAETAGKQLQWRIGELGARQKRVVEVNFRAEKPGSVANCCEATAAGGLKASDCATTTVTAPTVDVQITGPTQATVGGKVTFQITVTNRTQVPATKLLIKDRFDPGLDPPGVEEAVAKRTIESELGGLAAGASRQITITFRVTKEGRLCHTAEVSGPSTIARTAEACLIATTGAPGAAAPGAEQPTTPPGEKPSLVVKKTGPRQMTVGEIASFFIDVTNAGLKPLQNVRVVDSYDAALAPAFATDGYKLEGANLVWVIDNLPPGKAAQFEVQCKCEKAAAKACTRVSVTTSEGVSGNDEACLEIREAGGAPPAGELTMTIPGLHNPVSVGKGVTYKIQVTNNSTKTYRQVSLTATVPKGLVPAHLGTIGPGSTPFRLDLQTGGVYFDPVFEVKPGETLAYEVHMLAREPVQGKMRAELSSPDLLQPIVQEVSAEVVKGVGP